jgi:hypothetical protein
LNDTTEVVVDSKALNVCIVIEVPRIPNIAPLLISWAHITSFRGILCEKGCIVTDYTLKPLFEIGRSYDFKDNECH